MSKKTSSSSFDNSSLGRRPAKRTFLSILTRVKRSRSELGMVEDDRKSSSVIRIISGLVLVHIVLIGGVIMRGHLTKSTRVATAPGITAPPTAPTPETAQGAVPQNTEKAPTAPATVPRTTPSHITQPAFPEDDIAVAVDEAPPASTAQPTAATPTETSQSAAEPTQPAGTVLVKYRVKSGESWISIARAHNTTQQALRAANKNVRMLMSGSYILVPVSADSEAGRAAAERQAEIAANAPKMHTIKRGETLARIARQYKTTTQRLMKWNNLTPADTTKLRPGQKIKVSE